MRTVVRETCDVTRKQDDKLLGLRLAGETDAQAGNERVVLDRSFL